MTNWLFAIPAIYTIDTFGRRNLLLTTFPLMGLCLLWTGFSFWAPEGDLRLGLVASGIYLFMVIYSPGEGPVPFTYSAEAFPLYIRDVGMSFATATCWGFNFILSLTWPALVRAFRPQGAFAWYACWNFAAFFIAYFFLPETKVRFMILRLVWDCACKLTCGRISRWKNSTMSLVLVPENTPNTTWIRLHGISTNMC